MMLMTLSSRTEPVDVAGEPACTRQALRDLELLRLELLDLLLLGGVRSARTCHCASIAAA